VLLDPLGDYAPDHVPAIPGMARLAGWVSERFAVAPRNPEARKGETR
jgi:hypothetical protein